MDIMMREFAVGVYVPDDDDYIAIVQDILENEDFLSMANFIQHGTTTCLEHSIAVSYRSYITAKKYGLDSQSVARGGLLHDFFLYDWHSHQQETGNHFHGFTHPRTALENAEKVFELNDTEREIIVRHMWPLTVIPPKNKEAYVVLYHDKACSMRETFGKPSMDAVLPELCPVPVMENK